MSTVAEIERAALSLPREDLDRLLKRLGSFVISKPVVSRVVPWWESFVPFPEDEAEAFAADVAKGRQAFNRQPGFPAWD